MKKKKYTKFRTLFKTGNQREVDKFMDNLKDKEGISVYRRDFQDKDKTRFYIRKMAKDYLEEKYDIQAEQVVG